MSETFYGQISIPFGLIDSEVKNQLQKDFHLQHNFECLYSEDSICTFSNPYAVNGAFEELEHLLHDKQIPYDLISDTLFEIRAYYRPSASGEKRNEKVYKNPDGSTHIDANLLKPLLVINPVQAMIELQKLIKASSTEIDPLEEYIKGAVTPQTNDGEEV